MKNAFGILAAVIVLAGCAPGKYISSVEKENLFELNYGNFEDQLNMFNLSGAGSIDTSIAMSDGFFFISNPESKKIMEMNSYGDLISIFYNEETNPSPSFDVSTDSKTSTRAAVAFQFNEISKITVDSRKYLYVVDKLPSERQEFDAKSKLLQSQVVLRFDANKKFVDYIGQQGPGGIPFPYIKDIFTSERNELIVLCSTLSGNTVYWFSEDGFLMYTVILDNDNVPNPFFAEKKDVFYSVDNIVPDYRSRKLYLKVDYFSSYIDEASHVQSGIEYFSTLIYPFDLETKLYEKPLVIPPFIEEKTEGFAKETFEIPYDFMGVTLSGWFFFMLSTDEGFNIQMVQGDGQRILKRLIPADRSEILYHTFSLSREGIISALMVRKESASVNWWRIDSLIQSVIKK